MKTPFLLLVFIVLLVVAPPAFAEEGWHFRLSPYLWFAGLEGDAATIPGSPSAPIDISPSDALEDTEASFMIMLDARKGKHGVFADLIYSDVRSDEELIPPPIDLGLRSKSVTTLVTLGYQHEFYNREGFVVDAIAGGRFWNVDTELRFADGLGFLAGQKISNDESWIDPLLGAKGRAPLGRSGLYLAGGIAMGGFGIGSDLFYEINANVGYQWNTSIGTTVGYRMFDVDYENDGFLYDVRQEGWQLGLTWAF
jgi:hypothetical protein